MDSSQLTELCDRLVVRLSDCTLTRFQLIDMATVLMLMQRDLDRYIGFPDDMGLNAVTGPLHWIRDHAEETSVGELRTHVTTAVDAAAHLLAREAVSPQAGCLQLPH